MVLELLWCWRAVYDLKLVSTKQSASVQFSSVQLVTRGNGCFCVSILKSWWRQRSCSFLFLLYPSVEVPSALIQWETSVVSLSALWCRISQTTVLFSSLLSCCLQPSVKLGLLWCCNKHQHVCTVCSECLVEPEKKTLYEEGYVTVWDDWNSRLLQ